MDTPDPEKPYARQGGLEVFLVCVIGGGMLLAAIFVGSALYHLAKSNICPAVDQQISGLISPFSN